MGALPLGLVVTLLGVAWKPYLAPGAYGLPATAAMALVTIGGLPMCLGYLAWIVHWRARLAWLAPVGRMALTHYLGQSLLCTWTFYQYGLGRFETMPRSVQLLFALLLFAAQVVFSHLWLRHFRFGPIEWIWRAMTIGSGHRCGAGRSRGERWARMRCADRAPAHPHVWLAAGHGMLGISMSAGTGQLIADLVCVRTPAIDPALTDPSDSDEHCTL